MVNVGIAGIGFMGWIHWLAYQETKDARVKAICTRDEAKRAGDWTSIQGNFGPPGAQVDLSEVDCHTELDAMLADPEIDVIDICLPPHLHLEAVKKCFAAGKHVFCEKPLTVSSEDAQTLVNLAETSGKLLLVGQVLPFFPEFKAACDLVQEGKWGRPVGGTFKRLISDPLWLDDFYDPIKTGGPLIDLHVHDAHLIRMLFGMPTSLVSQGRMRGEVVEYCNTLFGFADPSLVVSSTCGVINQQGRPFCHAFELHLENATLQFEFAAFVDEAETMPLKVLLPDGTVERPELGNGDPILSFKAEIEEMIRSVQSGTPSKILSGELARDAIILCHKQTDAVKSGERVTI